MIEVALAAGAVFVAHRLMSGGKRLLWNSGSFESAFSARRKKRVGSARIRTSRHFEVQRVALPASQRHRGF